MTQQYVEANTVALIEELVERVRRMEALDAARSLEIRYARAVDAQDLDAIKELFLEDATLKLPGVDYRGRSDIVAFFERVFARDRKRNLRKHHFVTNIEPVWQDSGEIVVTASYLYRIDENGTPTGPIAGAGRYIDRVGVADNTSVRFRCKTIDE
jgi:ketosteroid isomerase-like protein